MKRKIEQKSFRFAELAPIKRLLSVDEAAFVLGISSQTIRNQLCRRSKKPFPIKPRRYGRKVLFHIDDVIRFADELPYDEKKWKKGQRIGNPSAL